MVIVEIMSISHILDREVKTCQELEQLVAQQLIYYGLTLLQCDLTNYFALTNIFITLEIHCGTVRYGTVRYGMVRYGTVRYGTVQYGMLRYGTARYGMVRYGTVWYGTVGK